MDEHELSRRLDAAAASVSARPDLAEIELGAGRARGRRRAVSTVVAAMLVAAAGGAGFGLGRAAADGEATLSADQPAADAAPTEADTDDDPPDEGPADAPDEPSTTVVATTIAPPSAFPGETVPPSETAGDVAADEAVFFPEGPGGPGGEPFELLVERTTASGVRVRLLGGGTWDSTWSEGGWTSAAFCGSSRDGRVTFDGADVVDVGYAGLWSEVYDGAEVSVDEVGWVDGHPLRYAVVTVAPGIGEVAITWADGLGDRTAVSSGHAVLVVEPSAPGEVWSMEYELELVGADGARIMTSDEVQHFGDDAYRAACQPPPPGLPEPGEQPEDPAAARAALEERFALLWDDSVERDAKRSLLDDWTGVDDAIDSLEQGTYAETAETAVHRIDEVSFTSPTEVWFRYTLLTDISDFGERYGTATLVDGAWQFPRALICQDLSLAGAYCDPDGAVEPIYPPSWYERYGDTPEQIIGD